ncbi:hypothetical protein [Leptospira santarosai]|uniref:hypothetical protein n=1 Tax=Leptospira santarosai TaxID=28183 RepID=UPI00051979D4|nr:hypothetical protein [Leptospira santarosai]MDI7182898.1 hypothetical protein [Leptospira santarosai]
MNEIREIKETVQRCRKRLIEYIESAGTVTEIEVLTQGKVRRSTLSRIRNGNLNAKIETLIEFAEKIQEAKIRKNY